MTYFNHQQLIELLRFYLVFCELFESDMKTGRPISEEDWQKYLKANKAVICIKERLRYEV